MSAGGMMLGSVPLSGFELPEHVTFGGAQRISIHRLPGGGQVADVMGADERDITWSGMMLGGDAAQRAQLIDQIRKSGQAVLLLFGDVARNVVVSQFEADYRGAYWIGQYRIRCTVLQDAQEIPASLPSNILACLEQAASLDPDNSSPGIASSAAAAELALASVGALVSGTAAAVTVGAALSAASAAAAAQMNGYEAQMAAAISGSAGSLGATSLAPISVLAEQLAKSGGAAVLFAQADLNLQNGSS